MPRTAAHRPDAVPWTELEVLRRKDGMGMRELSRLSGCAVSEISRCERGERLPTWEMIKKLAGALDVPVSVLTPDAMRLSDMPRPAVEAVPAADALGA